MSNEVVLKVENLAKRFKIYPGQTGRIREWLTFGRRSYHKDFWALDDVSFEVRKGEFLGIIGPNGAGKSTLLKVITGVLEPSKGSYTTSGRVLSLLELSGGMDNDLTGRENIIRSAQLLGFPDNYTKDRMEEIAEFAELGEFFDRPLFTFSSGMRIRLAFSLFAFMDCDILILDEVLAVGDIFFKQKCYARLEELIEQNVAIILVTHSTGTVRRYCNKVVVMNRGKIIFLGEAEKAVQKYFQIASDGGRRLNIEDTYIEEDLFLPRFDQSSGDHSLLDWPPEAVFLNSPLPDKLRSKGAQLTHLAVCDERGQPRQIFRQGEKVCFYYAYHIKENMGVPVAEFNLNTVKNILVHSKNSLQHNAKGSTPLLAGDRLRYKQVVALDIAPGKYIFSLTLFAIHPGDLDQLDYFTPKEFVEKLVIVARAKQAGIIEVITEKNSARNIHVGLCDLAGELNFQILNEHQQGLPE